MRTPPPSRGSRRLAASALIALALVQGVPFARAAIPTPGPSSPTGVRYLYLVRHGFYERDNAADDRTGNGLAVLGRQQARWLGGRLAGLPIRIDSLVCSDFLRARQTADELAPALGLTPIVDSLIRECTPTSDRPDLASRTPPQSAARCDSTLLQAWAKYVRPAGKSDVHEVLVCHGNVIRWFVTRVTGDPKKWASLDIGNASLTVIAVRPDGTARLVTFSDVGHLPVETQTWTGRGAGWAPPAAPVGR